MMKKLLNEVDRLVEMEYALASEQHGARFHSAHEAYAVMKEEADEAQDEIEIAVNRLGEFWRATKRDFEYGCDCNAKIIEKKAKLAAAEMIQLAAMAYKARISDEDISDNA